MVANFLWNPGTSNVGLTASAFTLMADTSELASLTTTSYVVSSVSGTSGVFSNSNSAQAIWAPLFLTLGAIGSALTTGANLAGWFLRSYDGTNFEQASVAPPRPPDFIIPLPATTITGATVWGSGLVLLPALKYKVGIMNNTGQTLAASGNTLRAAPVNMQTP
jgi:hypothetical protein